MNLDRKLQLEHAWHESEDFARDDNALIVGVYQSEVFREAESYHLDALGDVTGQHVFDYGCGTGGTTAQMAARGARVTGFDISPPGWPRRASARVTRPVWCSRSPRCCPLQANPLMRSWASRFFTTWI